MERVGLSGAFVTTNNYDTWRLCGVSRQPGSGAPAVTYANAYSATGYLSQRVRVNTASNDNCANYGTYPQPVVLWQADAQDAAERVTASSLGNGLTVSRSYDPFTGRLSDSATVNSSNGNSNLVSEGYQYDVLVPCPVSK